MIRFHSKSDMDSFSFSDEDLRIAAQAVRNAMVCALPDASKCQHTFSERFLRKMRSLFQIDRRRMQRKAVLRHVAVFIIGIFITASLFLAFNPEARADFVSWARSIYEKSIFYEFFTANNSSQDIVDLSDIEFTWLPDDYTIQDTYKDDYKQMVLLMSTDDAIMLECWPAETIDYLELYTEGFVREQTVVNGRAADALLSSDPTSSNALIWMSQDESVVFELTAAQPVDVLIRIAEGITQKNK